MRGQVVAAVKIRPGTPVNAIGEPRRCEARDNYGNKCGLIAKRKLGFFWFCGVHARRL